MQVEVRSKLEDELAQLVSCAFRSEASIKRSVVATFGKFQALRRIVVQRYESYESLYNDS